MVKNDNAKNVWTVDVSKQTPNIVNSVDEVLSHLAHETLIRFVLHFTEIFIEFYIETKQFKYLTCKTFYFYFCFLLLSYKDYFLLIMYTYTENIELHLSS